MANVLVAVLYGKVAKVLGFSYVCLYVSGIFYTAIYSLPYMFTNVPINSKHEHSPLPGKTPGEFFEVVKSPARGKNFLAKARPPGQKTPTPGSILEDLVSFSC